MFTKETTISKEFLHFKT